MLEDAGEDSIKELSIVQYLSLGKMVLLVQQGYDSCVGNQQLSGWLWNLRHSKGLVPGPANLGNRAGRGAGPEGLRPTASFAEWICYQIIF